MEITRRRFLGAAAVLGLAPIPRFLLRAAERVSPASGEKVLVVLQLTGGNDGLNTVIPFEDPAYHRSRPSLAIGKGDALRLDAGDLGAGPAGGGPGAAEIGLHPRMKGLWELYREGQVAIVQGAGYPNPSRSHFRSMDIWHTARPESEDVATGWLGRALLAGRERLSGLHLGDERLPLALEGELQVPTLQSLDWLDSLASSRGIELRRRLHALNVGERGGDVEKVRELALATLRQLDGVLEVRGKPAPVAYPDSRLAERLRWVGQLIGGGYPSRIYYLSQTGYDTHAQEKEIHGRLLGDLSDGLRAFQSHLRALGASERVVVVVFSEFGRRVRENGSLGTDHGSAAPMLVVSGAARGGLHGAHPSLADLEDGDVRFHTDFRRVYATLLDEVLGLDPSPVLFGRFEKLPLLARRARV